MEDGVRAVLYDERDERFVMPVLIGEVGQMTISDTGGGPTNLLDEGCSLTARQLKTVTTLSGRRSRATETM